jgi:hypothetical protein
MCDSKELIVGLLYDELTNAERKELQAHLAVCSECSAEVEGLRSTRTYLALWSPPEPDLGFRMIRGGSAPVEALPRPRRLAPLFALAAAAVIVLAAAAAIANVEIHYSSDGVTVRTGWADRTQIQAEGPGAPAARPVRSSMADGEPDALADLDRRVRTIEASVPNSTTALQLTRQQIRMSDAQLLRQVRQMLSEAQAQQKTAFAHQMLQVVRDVQQQHMSDIALLQQGLEQYQGVTNAEIATSRDMFNQWIRASARQEK